MTPQTHAMRTSPHSDLIEAFLDHMVNRHRTPRTIQTYGEALWGAHQALPAGLPQALPAELEHWLATPGWAAGTQALRLTAMRQFFGWAIRRSHIDYDPTEKLERPQLPHLLPRSATDEQVATILRCTGAPVRLWSLIASRAGLRCIEIARLERVHINEQEIHVLGKGHRERRVPTHPAIWRAIGDLPAGHIADRNERAISDSCWYIYNRKLGLGTSIHRLRAWYATSMLRAGHDLATVQDLLGHASPTTTRRYATPSAAQLRAATLSVPDPDPDV